MPGYVVPGAPHPPTEAEMAGFGGADGIARIEKRIEGKKGFSTIIYIFLSGFCLSFTLFVYAPLEMYLNNIGEFEFGLAMFWWIPALAGAAATGLAVGLGLLAKRLFKRAGALLYGAFLFAAGLACYIQGNFAGLKLGPFSGIPVKWEDPGIRAHMLGNALLWLAIILAVFALLYFFRSRWARAIMLVAAIMVAMQAMTLAVQSSSAGFGKDPAEANMVVSDKGLFEVSTQKNVIVFVLDMLDDEYFKILLETDPTIKDDFSGFTFFANSVGSYSTTLYAMGAMMTGQYLLNDGDNFQDMVDKAYDRTDFYDVLLTNGFRLDIYTEDGGSQKLWDKMYNYTESSEAYIASYPTLFKRLYRLVLCKYAPDALKPYVWMDGTEFNGMVKRDVAAHSYSNAGFVAALRGSDFALDSGDSLFKLIHIDGAHYPHTVDENADPAPPGYSDLVATSRGALRIVYEYLQKMKGLGVYDQATIIVCADHGFNVTGVLTNPVLLVKRAGGSGGLQVSDAPVSHMDLHATIMDDLGLNPGHKYGESVFEIAPGEARNRLFYQYAMDETRVNEKFRLIEYRVSDESNLRRSFELTDREFTPSGDVIPHRANCAYCLSGAYDEEDPDTPGSVPLVHTPK